MRRLPVTLMLQNPYAGNRRWTRGCVACCVTGIKPVSAAIVSRRQDGNPANPEIVAYRDPHMNHTNFVPNRYFTTTDVRDFFKADLRIDI
jgi:hypothetical protein